MYIYKDLDDQIKLENTVLISGNIRSQDIRRSSILTLIAAIPKRVSIPRLSLSAMYFNVDRSNRVDWSIEVRPRPMFLVSCRVGIVLLIVHAFLASDTRDQETILSLNR
jgi:hypothetical protein